MPWFKRSSLPRSELGHYWWTASLGFPNIVFFERTKSRRVLMMTATIPGPWLLQPLEIWMCPSLIRCLPGTRNHHTLGQAWAVRSGPRLVGQRTWQRFSSLLYFSIDWGVRGARFNLALKEELKTFFGRARVSLLLGRWKGAEGKKMPSCSPLKSTKSMFWCLHALLMGIQRAQCDRYGRMDADRFGLSQLLTEASEAGLVGETSNPISYS